MNQSPVQGDVKITDSSFVREVIKTIIIAAVIVLPIRIFIAQPFIVSGSSMDPTFNNGDYLIVDQLSYRFAEVDRYDVIIFRYPKDPSKFFIKRVIGLPGETVSIKDGVVFIKPPNEGVFRLEESYVENKSRSTSNATLGESEYFVMGDNRGASSDSRIWGPLNKDFLVGRAYIRLLPISKIDLNPGEVLPF